MKLTKTREVRCCDNCSKDNVFISACDNCGAEYCQTCKEGRLLDFQHAVYFSGSGDACYCIACVEKLTAANDPRLKAYLAIQDLRAESEEAGRKFKARVAQVEADVQRFARRR